MNYDALTVLAVRDELRATILGGRIQHVHHPDDLGVVFELYARSEKRWLYASCHPQHARVHLLAERPPRPSDEVTPLLLLLRKYADGGRIDAIDTPPLERILRLQLSRRAPSGEIWRTDLVAEVMGRFSNLALLDADGAVLDALRRAPPGTNPARVVAPRWRYELPPLRDKLDPRTVEAAALAAAAGRHDGTRKATEVLIAEVNACGPMLAREVVFRATTRVDTPAGEADWTGIAAAQRDLWQDALHGRASPSVAYDEERLVAFAPYLIRSFPDVRPVSSISAALEAWYDRPGRGVAVDEARRRPLRQALAAAQDRLRAKRYSLTQSMVDPDEMERARRAGEALLSRSHEVAVGRASLTLPEEGLSIELDPSLTVVQNAQRYFARYSKLKAAAQEVPALREAVDNELRYIDDALTLLELAASPQELNDLRSEWAELGYASAASGEAGKERRSAKRTKSTPSSGPRGATGVRREAVGGYEVLVGRSGKGNDWLLGRETHPDDVWLHARGIPGAHVLVRARGGSVPEPVLRQAAALAAAHSQARSAGSVAVDYTLRKHVRRIRGAPPGLVTYRGERTLHVTPASESYEREQKTLIQ